MVPLLDLAGADDVAGCAFACELDSLKRSLLFACDVWVLFAKGSFEDDWNGSLAVDWGTGSDH